MAQGPTRLGRGLAFHRYVNESLHAHHNLIVVPFCSHSQRCIFTSDVGNLEQTQDHHQRSMRLVHWGEQTVKNPEQEDKLGRASQFRDDTEAEKPAKTICFWKNGRASV